MRQWAEFDPHVDALETIDRGNGTIEVEVHQLVKSLRGDVLSDTRLRHVYIVSKGLIERMDVDQDEGGTAGQSAAFPTRS